MTTTTFCLPLLRRAANSACAPLALAFLLASPSTLSAQRLDRSASPTRAADEDVKSQAVRERAGMIPGRNLLHTGWGVTPAGQHVRLAGDMPLKRVVAPDQRVLVSVDRKSVV